MLSRSLFSPVRTFFFSSNAVSSAPAFASSASALSEQGSAAPQNESYKEGVLSRGVPERYAYEREERARPYALKQGRSVGEVLSEWWSRESESTKRKYVRASRAAPQADYSTCDFDEFFAAAIARSQRN